MNKAEVDQCINQISTDLLQRQQVDGVSAFWRGRLSSSALSTALACLALQLNFELKNDDKTTTVIEQGLLYLISIQVSDGSWGDTDNSPGNLSTTVLVWSCFVAVENNCKNPNLLAQISHKKNLSEIWIRAQVGSLEPSALVQHIEATYGKDKTFSVPILMACCSAGCLGQGIRAWSLVKQLPFELAAFPQKCYAALRMPVVSYALPALIAIGYVRHSKRPTWFLPLRFIRTMLRQRCLKKLASIQPENGGFLEATPLTAFVAIALAQAGLIENVVLKRACEFLIASQRPDGSWPIDTDLATWVSSLSVHALDTKTLAQARPQALLHWYTSIQTQKPHPYTGSKPGAWAWSDLPGAVPDADDTSGALLALYKLGCTDMQAIEAGIKWLLQLQNDDGGMPTFCRGWGTLAFDKSCVDISAHTMRAMRLWQISCSPLLQKKITLSLGRMEKYVKKQIGSRGEWLPLWFGNQSQAKHANPVLGTARVILALNECKHLASLCQSGIHYLLSAQHEDGSWGPDVGCQASVEETALAIEALSAARLNSVELDHSLDKAVSYLCRQWQSPVQAQPIGLYFASLWYYEDMYPLCFSLAALHAYRQRREAQCV